LFVTTATAPTPSADPASSDPRPDRRESCACRRDAAAEQAERHSRVLKRLIEIGMELAETVRTQALAPSAGKESAPACGSEAQAGAAPPGGSESLLAFWRITRAVRQTVALEAKLTRDGEERAVAAARERHQQQKMKVKRAVKRVIKKADRGPFKTADWLDDLRERLEDLDDTDLGDRPIGEIVARICRDLGVDFDRRLWEEESGASEGSRAGEAAAPPKASAGSGRADVASAGRRQAPPHAAAAGSDPPSRAGGADDG
jgi:hypothetical protein